MLGLEIGILEKKPQDSPTNNQLFQTILSEVK
jgi:hypothetical protein